MTSQRPRVGQIANIIPAGFETGPESDQTDRISYREHQANEGLYRKLIQNRAIRIARFVFSAPVNIYRDIKGFAEASEGTNIGVYMENHPEEFSHLRKDK